MKMSLSSIYKLASIPKQQIAYHYYLQYFFFSIFFFFLKLIKQKIFTIISLKIFLILCQCRVGNKLFISSFECLLYLSMNFSLILVAYSIKVVTLDCKCKTWVVICLYVTGFGRRLKHWRKHLFWKIPVFSCSTY